jgi:hypothetical protein
VSRGLSSSSWVAVGLDNGGTSNNATVIDAGGRFLVDRLLETPSRVREGPDVAVDALVRAFELALDATGLDRPDVWVVGLDTPGPASADGVISSVGSTNFSHPGWGGFDVRGALEDALGAPVVYTQRRQRSRVVRANGPLRRRRRWPECLLCLVLRSLWVLVAELPVELRARNPPPRLGHHAAHRRRGRRHQHVSHEVLCHVRSLLSAPEMPRGHRRSIRPVNRTRIS